MSTTAKDMAARLGEVRSYVATAAVQETELAAPRGPGSRRSHTGQVAGTSRRRRSSPARELTCPPGGAVHGTITRTIAAISAAAAGSSTTYLVRNAGDRMLARVTSIGQVLAIGAAALGPVVGGTLIQRYGSHGALLILLAAVVILAVLSLGRPGTWATVAVRVLRPAEWLVLADVAVAGCFAAAWKRCRRPVASSAAAGHGSWASGREAQVIRATSTVDHGRLVGPRADRAPRQPATLPVSVP